MSAQECESTYVCYEVMWFNVIMPCFAISPPRCIFRFKEGDNQFVNVYFLNHLSMTLHWLGLFAMG